MKKGIILSCLAVFVVAAHEKPAYNQPVTSTWAKYRADDVKVLGIVEYGHSQNAVDRTVAGPRYRAFVFSGYGRDRVEITLKGAIPGLHFILTDSTLAPIGSGSTRATLSLPYRGPDIEVYYIVFPAYRNAANVTVQIKKVGRDMSPVKLMTEIKSPSPESYKQGGF